MFCKLGLSTDRERLESIYGRNKLDFDANESIAKPSLNLNINLKLKLKVKGWLGTNFSIT